MKISTITGHLTATEKNAIRQMIDLKLKSGKTPRKLYHLSLKEDVYTVSIQENNRGLIPCAGSELRQTTNKATFKI
jgi:hypothetical protein